MTSKERCYAILRNEVPDRVPVIPQSFMFSIMEAGLKIGDINRNGRKMAETHIICQEKYGYDGCVIDFDDASLAEACGAKIILRENEPAIVDETKPLLKNLRDVYDLELPDPRKAGRLPEWLEATRELSDAIGDSVFIMGRADQGPFSVASLLRGTRQFLVDLMTEDPNVLHDVIDYCRKACVAFAKAQKDAGADVTSIGDALAGPNLISPEMYNEFAWGPEKKMSREVQDYGIPLSIHICGDTTTIIERMAATGARILEVDWQVDMGGARKRIPADTILMGNINPSDPMVFGTKEQVEASVKEIIRKTRGKKVFISTGCAMGRNTPPENFRMMIETVHKYGTREMLESL